MPTCDPSSRKRGAVCGRRAKDVCDRPATGELTSFEDIVTHYDRCVRPDVEREKRHFGDRDSCQEAIEAACSSISYDHKMHSHQRRVGSAKLERACKILSVRAAELLNASDFVEIFDIVRSLQGRGLGIGPLAIYDISERIAWFRGFEPTDIYLHAGTAEGARLFAPGWRDETMPVQSPFLPKAFRRVAAADLENILCMYKADIKRLLRLRKREPAAA